MLSTWTTRLGLYDEVTGGMTVYLAFMFSTSNLCKDTVALFDDLTMFVLDTRHV